MFLHGSFNRLVTVFILFYFNFFIGNKKNLFAYFKLSTFISIKCFFIFFLLFVFLNYISVFFLN